MAAKVEWGSDPRLDPVSRAFVRVTIDGKSAEESAFDFFSPFQVARRSFEAEGFRFMCYGASLNVWPSGMLRDMGVGSKGYKLLEGRNTMADDLVSIFDSGDDVIQIRLYHSPRLDVRFPPQSCYWTRIRLNDRY